MPLINHNDHAPARVRDFSIEPTLRVQLFEYEREPIRRFQLVRLTARTSVGDWRTVILKPYQWQALLHALLDINHDLTVGRIDRQ